MSELDDYRKRAAERDKSNLMLLIVHHWRELRASQRKLAAIVGDGPEEKDAYAFLAGMIDCDFSEVDDTDRAWSIIGMLNARAGAVRIPQRPGAELRTICAWCGQKEKIRGQWQPLASPSEPGVSHGMCDDCEQEARR